MGLNKGFGVKGLIYHRNTPSPLINDGRLSFYAVLKS